MKCFGHTRPVRDDSGQIVGDKQSPARAKTIGVLGHNFGKDKNRRLIVSLEGGDVVCVKPERTGRVASILAADLYHYLLRCSANRVMLEKARQKKAKKAERLAAMRIERAHKRLFKK